MSSNQVSHRYTWFIPDDIPRTVQADCSVNFHQNYMLISPYIGFHDISIFSVAKPLVLGPEDDICVVGGSTVKYYKGSTLLGSASTIASSNVLVSGDWI